MHGIEVWYLILSGALGTIAPFYGNEPMIGPMTESHCRDAAKSFSAAIPEINPVCKRVVGQRMCVIDNGARAYACPIFEGEITQTGK